MSAGCCSRVRQRLRFFVRERVRRENFVRDIRPWSGGDDPPALIVDLQQWAQACTMSSTAEQVIGDWRSWLGVHRQSGLQAG
jgi:hypothetical protein